MTRRRSLRSEFLVYIALIAGTAALLAVLAGRSLAAAAATNWIVPLLLVVGMVAFTVAGNFLLQRWVLRPLAGIGRVADAIAAGDYDQRAAEDGPREIASLANTLNHLTDQLLANQRRLAENVQSLDDTNRRLTEAQRDLVQAEKLASLGRLAAGVAHEIGNPLGAILGYVAVQKRRGGEPELLEGIEREAGRIDRIVRDLLVYARPVSSNRDAVDVNESARRVVELLREQGRLASIELELRLEEGIPPVHADPHRLDQIFVNLLRNAESATGDDGRVIIETAPERHAGDQGVAPRRADDPPGVNYLHLRGVRSPANAQPAPVVSGTEGVRITIADTGAGIPEEMLDSIFDPFFTTKAPGEGSGLGLAIVAGTVAELGGRIEARSNTGTGTSFGIWLPAAERGG